MNTWLLMRGIEIQGERDRVLYLLKSRGMAHSNQVREFRLTGCGVNLLDVYLGPAGVLTGSARLQQEARDRAALLAQSQDRHRRQRKIERNRKRLEGRLDEIRLQLAAESDELAKLDEQEKLREHLMEENRAEMTRMRQADQPSGIPTRAKGKGRAK